MSIVVAFPRHAVRELRRTVSFPWVLVTASTLLAMTIAMMITLMMAPLLPGGYRAPTLAKPKPAAALTRAQRALVEATSATTAGQREVGATAEQDNRALPLSTAPIEAARPFILPVRSSATDGEALQCLTQAIYYEAGFEPESGKRAVAQVVLNRVRHPAFPHSVCGVVFQGAPNPGCQFSFACDGSMKRLPVAGAWRAARGVAQWALAGGIEQSVGMATHYHTDWVFPSWAPKLTKVALVGTQIFYRWPGSWGRPGAFVSAYSGNEQQWLNVPATPGEDTATNVAIAGPIERRAPDDVGGRLDMSKGWTLSIPAPKDSGGAMARVGAAQSVVASDSGAAGPRGTTPIEIAGGQR